MDQLVIEGAYSRQQLICRLVAESGHGNGGQDLFPSWRWGFGLGKYSVVATPRSTIPAVDEFLLYSKGAVLHHQRYF